MALAAGVGHSAVGPVGDGGGHVVGGQGGVLANAVGNDLESRD